MSEISQLQYVVTHRICKKNFCMREIRFILGYRFIFIRLFAINYVCKICLFVGALVGLTSVILVDLLGIDKLTNAFGLLLLFQGIGSFIGPPIAGSMFDQTQSYTASFIFAGSSMVLSGFILYFCIPILQRNSTYATNQKANAKNNEKV